MNAKRKRIEDEESEDMDDSSTASESGEESGSGSEVSDDEEQVVEQEPFSPILIKLSRAVSKKDASELLHSMATSKGILFWTPKGEMLYKNRRIPVASIAKLSEYIFLPYNREH